MGNPLITRTLKALANVTEREKTWSTVIVDVNDNDFERPGTDNLVIIRTYGSRHLHNI